MNLSELKYAFQNKRIFVTGHTGFKGSWLINILQLFGAKIKGYALPPRNSDDLFNVIQGDKICDSIIADIRDAVKLKKVVLSFQPDFIFHLAAQPLVRLSYEIPAETFEVNALGTAYLLDAVKSLEKKCTLVLITTDKVYHNNEWIYPYRENDRLGGYDPYSASKACAELVIDSYRNSFFSNEEYNKHQKSIAVARAGNVIGGGDWSKDRIIPDIVKSLKQDIPIQIRNPNSIRPWQHVLEPLFGYLLLAKKLEEDPASFSGAWNFGPFESDTLMVHELVAIAIKVWGCGKADFQNLVHQPHEAGVLKLDISKVVAKLGWSPQWSSDRAIVETINWYKQSEKNQCDFTLNQIKEYIGL